MIAWVMNWKRYPLSGAFLLAVINAVYSGWSSLPETWLHGSDSIIERECCSALSRSSSPETSPLSVWTLCEPSFYGRCTNNASVLVQRPRSKFALSSGISNTLSVEVSESLSLKVTGHTLAVAAFKLTCGWIAQHERITVETWSLKLNHYNLLHRVVSRVAVTWWDSETICGDVDTPRFAYLVKIECRISFNVAISGEQNIIFFQRPFPLFAIHFNHRL